MSQFQSLVLMGVMPNATSKPLFSIDPTLFTILDPPEDGARVRFTTKSLICWVYTDTPNVILFFKKAKSIPPSVSVIRSGFTAGLAN